MNTKRIVIVTGGALGPWAHQELRQDDILIGSDRGALYLIEQGWVPDYAIGDFDSVTPEQLERIRTESKQILVCDPIDKDYTDTEMAFNWALRQNPSEIVLLGALGTRIDHSLANIHLLRKAVDQGIRSVIIDAHNEIILINRPAAITKGPYANVSLLPLGMEVTGITLHGFQYPLHRATLQIGQSLGISNVLLEQQGLIEIETGYLLVIQSRD